MVQNNAPSYTGERDSSTLTCFYLSNLFFPNSHLNILPSAELVDFNYIRYNKRMEGPQKKEEKFKVRCISCNKEVEVALKPFGDGYIATCPDCGNLAYNKESKPSLTA
jgi:predicted RNA-binding Zn-ribbon protein involved in translation (DUF1610 family)